MTHVTYRLTAKNRGIGSGTLRSAIEYRLPLRFSAVVSPMLGITAPACTRGAVTCIVNRINSSSFTVDKQWNLPQGKRTGTDSWPAPTPIYHDDATHAFYAEVSFINRPTCSVQ